MNDNIELPSYFKYISDNADVINGIFRNNKIRFTQPSALNDPLEFNPQIIYKDSSNSYIDYRYKGKFIPRMNEWIKINLIESNFNNIGLLSLTKRPSEYMMWNMYANGHKGFVIEFEENILDFDGFNDTRIVNPLRKVTYTNDYSISYDDIFDDKFEETSKLEYILTQFGSKKTDHWQYEKEYRLFTLFDDVDCSDSLERNNKVICKNFDINVIKSVILGVFTSKENRNLILEYSKIFGFDVYQSVLFRDHNCKMAFLQGGDFKNNESYANKYSNVFILDEIELKYLYEPIIDVDSLEMIPFYDSIKDQVDSFLKGEKFEL